MAGGGLIARSAERRLILGGTLNRASADDDLRATFTDPSSRLRRGRCKNPDKSTPKPPPDFQADTSIFKKKQTLPGGYKFKLIESGSLDLTITDGLAYIHFFPQGLIETSAIQVEDPKGTIWTLVYNPLTGRSDVMPEAKLLKELAR